MEKTKEIPWYEILTKNNRDLRMANPATIRLFRTGHPLPLSRNWALTVGLWGGQCTAAEIGKVAQRDPRAVRTYAQSKGLRLATRSSPRIPQAAVALQTHRYWMSGKAEGSLERGWRISNIIELADWVGVYPIEALYYVQAVPALAKLAEQEIEELSEYENDELQQLWLQARLRLYFPRTANDETTIPAEVTNLLTDTFQ